MRADEAGSTDGGWSDTRSPIFLGLVVTWFEREVFELERTEKVKGGVESGVEIAREGRTRAKKCKAMVERSEKALGQ